MIRMEQTGPLDYDLLKCLEGEIKKIRSRNVSLRLNLSTDTNKKAWKLVNSCRKKMLNTNNYLSLSNQCCYI